MVDDNQNQMGTLIISGKVFPLHKGLNLIGRSKNATVILRNESVSQHQAIITIIDDTQHFISDVYSSNGTKLNKNNLHPLNIYELQDDNVIEFATVVGTYRKTPGGLNNALTPVDDGTLQSTQNVDDSFYSANTQTVEEQAGPGPLISDVHHNGYFDDGYDFNNLPSPPCVTSISPRKTEMSIHEMPTQLYNNIDIDNMENEIEIAQKSKHLTVHDLPTQLMFHNIGTNECIEETIEDHCGAIKNININEENDVHPSTSSAFIHSTLPNENFNDSHFIPQTQDSPPPKGDQQHLDVSDDIIDQTAINDSVIDSNCHSNAQVQTRSFLTLVESTPYKITNSRSILDKRSQCVLEGDKIEVIESQEIGQLKKKCRPLENYSEGDSDNKVLQDNANLSTASQSQEIQYMKKPIRQIDSYTDDETSQIDPMEPVVQNLEENTFHAYSPKSKSKTDNTTAGRTMQSAGELNESSIIDSDSETDIELDCENENNSGLDNIQSEWSSNNKVVNVQVPSASNTSEKPNVTITNNEECADFQKQNEGINENNMSKRDSDDTFFIPATQCSDDGDTSNDFHFMCENTTTVKPNKDNIQGSVLDISQKLNELRQRNSSHQNCTEESIHFTLTDIENSEDISNKTNGSNNNASITEKANSALETQPGIFEEATQKIDVDLMNKSGHNKNVDVDQLDRNISKKINGTDFGVALPLEKSLNGNDIFMLSTQINIVENTGITESVANKTPNVFEEEATQKVDSLNHNNDIYIQPTQRLEVEQDNVFTTPNAKKTSSDKSFSTSTPSDLNEDDIFLQPTQQMDYQNTGNTELCNDKSTFVKLLPSSSRKESNTPKLFNTDDDMFLMPTQPLSLEKGNDDNIFELATQELPKCLTDDSILKHQRDLLSPTLLKKNLVINNNIFLKPPQRDFNNMTSKETIDENEDENIFLQPTQMVTATVSTSNKENDMSMNENIFLQPTQENQEVLAVDDGSMRSTTPEAVDDIFLQPTQVLKEPVEVDDIVRPSLSLLNKGSKGINNDDEEESQLEVAFASQNVKLSSQINSRPQNPLLNILKESDQYVEDETGLNNEVIQDKDSPIELSSVNAYHEMETLAVDDLYDDFQAISMHSKKKIQKAENLETTKPSSSKKEKKSKAKSNKTNNITIRKTRRHYDVDSPFQTDLENVDQTQEQGERVANKSNESIQLKNSETGSVKPNKAKRVKLAVPESSPIHNSTTKLNSTSMTQTRSARTRRQNIEKETPQESTVKDIRTTTNTRRAKTKLDYANEDEVTSAKKIRGKLDQVHETPKATSKTATRRVKKLNLEQQENTASEPDLNLRKRKPRQRTLTEDSDITISSTEIYEEVIATKKPKRHNNDDEIKKTIGTTSERRKGVLISENSPNKTMNLNRKHLHTEGSENTIHLQALSTPERQRRLQKPKVVFTMLNDPSLESLIRSLGGSVVDTVKSCTVLVTAALKRSQKLLSAVGEAKPICGTEWLYASKKAGAFLDPWDHLLYDKEAETKWKFTLKESLSRSSNLKLLANNVFYIMTTVNIDVLKAAIETCGGKLISRVPTKYADNIIVIGSPETRKKYLKLLQQNPPIKVVAPEAIFDGVLRQELHWEDHLLT